MIALELNNNSYYNIIRNLKKKTVIYKHALIQLQGTKFIIFIR